jgi:DNA-binding response OmpR family regulator
MRKKILIVDDEMTFGQLIKLNLEETEQYEVRVETQGIRAIDTARDFQPDLILLDIVMPDVDGGEIAHLIKADKLLKDIPIIFLTALVQDKEVDSKGGMIGGHPFVAKPVSTDELIDIINKNIKH